ncbi:citrate synthase, partial [Thioclava sp. BHET1]
MSDHKGWITRDEAIEILRIRPQTLYAYVSRNLIGVRAAPGKLRQKLYREEDVAALCAKRTMGRARQSIANSTMAWGEPIIETRISTIAYGRLFYRGQDAVLMSRESGLEAVAALLWEMAALPKLTAFHDIAEDAVPRERAFVTLGRLAATGMP